jgi:hypothetical protein
MANKEKDKQAKVAPPRPTDAARMAHFMNITGLKVAHSAKYRRLVAGAQRRNTRS